MAIIQTYSIYEYISSTISLPRKSMQKIAHIMLMKMYSLQIVNGVLGAYEFCILDGIVGSKCQN